MLAHVTNQSPGQRGVLLVDNSTFTLDPGDTALLDLADHPVHRGWVASGDITIVPEAEEPATEAVPARGKPPRRVQT